MNRVLDLQQVVPTKGRNVRASSWFSNTQLWFLMLGGRDQGEMMTTQQLNAALWPGPSLRARWRSLSGNGKPELRSSCGKCWCETIHGALVFFARLSEKRIQTLISTGLFMGEQCLWTRWVEYLYYFRRGPAELKGTTQSLKKSIEF